MSALQTLDFLIAENEASFWMFRQFLTREPMADEFEGVKLLYGRNCFIQNLDEANIGVAIQEGRDQNMRAGLRTAESRLINKLRDISYFEVKFVQVSRRGRNESEQAKALYIFKERSHTISSRSV